MAEITLSIGTASEELVTIIDATDETTYYEVTLDASPSTTGVGDILTDAIGNTFRITDVNGAVLQVVDFGQTDEIPVGFYNLSSSSSSGSDYGSPSSTIRAYSTMTAWESDLDNTNIYSASDDAIGMCYNDSTFDEMVTIDSGGTVGLSSTLLTAADDDRHDGTTAGAGVTNDSSGGGTFYAITLDLDGVDRYLSWMKVTSSGTIIAPIRTISSASCSGFVQNNLVYGHSQSTSSDTRGILIATANTIDLHVTNNIVTNVENTANNSADCNGIEVSGGAAGSVLANNTVHNLYKQTGTGNAAGIRMLSDDADWTLSNNLATTTANDGAGTAQDFEPSSFSNVTTQTNMSSDATSPESDLRNVTPADQYVSTVEGSEDLHLKRNADALGVGTDLGGTNDVGIDIDGQDRDSYDTTWDIGASQYRWIVSIGTASRDYSTISAFEADVGLFIDKELIGLCYNDSVFDESVQFNDASPNQFTLSVAEADRHDGTAGTGARIVRSSGSTYLIEAACNPTNGQIYEWLELDHNGNQSDNGGAIRQTTLVDTSNRTKQVCRNLLIYGCYKSGGRFNHGIDAGGRPMSVCNAIVYRVGDNLTTSGSSGTYGIGGDDKMDVYNCTVANVKHNYSGIAVYGISIPASSGNVKNCIVMDVSGAGTVEDYNGSGAGYASFLTSISEDATGTTGLTNKTYVDQFTSTVVGAEDYRLKLGSDAAGAGTDLGNTLDINIDITGTDREGFSPERWSIGAHEGPQEIVKTIGTTARDYSTVAAWEADLEDATLYLEGDHVIGEMYNDSTFTAGATFSATSIALGKVTLRAADSDRHDGTAGTGARIEQNIDRILYITTMGTDADVEISDIELYGTGSSSSRHLYFNMGNLVGEVKRCLIHGGEYSIAGTRALIVATGRNKTLTNNILYDFQMTAGGDAHGIYCDNLLANIYNNTIDNITALSGNTGYGITTINDHFTTIVKNNAITRCDQCIEETAPANADYDYNATSDSSASGGNSLTDITTEDQYTSIVGGSEDYTLLEDADLRGVALDLTTTSDANYDIIKQNRDHFDANTWDIGAHQYELTASIGTDSRDYSTITAYEADLGDTDIYGPTGGSNAKGVLYNDSEFDEAVDFNPSNINSLLVTAAESDRHDGTAGTGVRVVRSGNISYGLKLSSKLNSTSIIEWIEYDLNTQTSSGGGMFQIASSNTGNNNERIINCMAHGGDGVDSSFSAFVNRESNRAAYFANCIAYDINCNEYTGAAFSGIQAVDNLAKFYNCTVYKMSRSDGTATAEIYGINMNGGVVANCISMDTTDTVGTLNEVADFKGTDPTYSLSSDSTADGTGCISGKDSDDQFVSTVEGSEDLHLKEDSDAIGVGIDLGSTYNVNIDINGFDRDATAIEEWDMGAHQLSAKLTIGTAGRTYSTVTAFEADLSNFPDMLVTGEMYNDSDFDESVTINDTTPASVLIRPATGEQHDGTAGTGVRIVASTDRVWDTRRDLITINGIEFDLNGHGSVSVISNAGNTHGNEVYLCCLLIHDVSSGAGGLKAVNGSGRDVNVHDCVIYDLLVSGTGSDMWAIFNDADQSWAGIRNNTVYRVRQITSGSAYGILTSDLSNGFVKNNIAIGAEGVGGNSDFVPASPSNADMDYNISGDSSAYGDHSLINQAATDIFVSVVDGAEDFNLKQDSPAFNAGIDLSADDITIDIIGTARPQFGSFDIGAFESLIDLSPAVIEAFDSFFRLL